MKIAIIGGSWDDNNGKPSGYIKKLYTAIKDLGHQVVEFNGGGYKFLEQLLDISRNNSCLKHMDCIFWLPNIPNDKEKIVRNIKDLFPKCMLITSKNNYDKKYEHMELVARALQTKSNLLMVFDKSDDVINCTILDPLCNVWATKETEIEYIAKIIIDRTEKLASFTRIGSECIGHAIKIPEQEEFFEVVRSHADKFHKLIHGVSTSRFLGNASFRCEKGFPSFRKDDYIFVSKRNLDKRDLNENGFVAVNPNSLVHGSIIQYYGDHKPSVDTPVQLCLYNYYKRINYIIHSHVYIQGAPFTSNKIPCGAIEEADAIIDMMPWKDGASFAVNLRGHGSVIMTEQIHQFDYFNFFARPVPEY